LATHLAYDCSMYPPAYRGKVHQSHLHSLSDLPFVSLVPPTNSDLLLSIQQNQFGLLKLPELYPSKHYLKKDATLRFHGGLPNLH
ncbi:MAG: hypothetical protein K2N06_12040, partial [Oscillospiraceae bacterium]|nr:hypothetical protein [Oscillospiraceae bacterium]